MQAYKCDGCGEFQEGSPEFELRRDREIEVFGHTNDYQLCSWQCVHKVAEAKIGAGS